MGKSNNVGLGIHQASAGIYTHPFITCMALGQVI